MGRTNAQNGQGHGFTRLTSNKYFADVVGVTRQDVLELPEPVYDKLDTDGFLMQRVRVTAAADESLGQYSGALTDVAASADIAHGARIPAIRELFDEHEPVRSVCITFADDDTALSVEAMGFATVQDGAGVTAYFDRLDDFGD